MKYGVAWLLGVPVSIIALWFVVESDGLRLLADNDLFSAREWAIHLDAYNAGVDEPSRKPVPRLVVTPVVSALKQAPSTGRGCDEMRALRRGHVSHARRVALPILPIQD